MITTNLGTVRDALCATPCPRCGHMSLAAEKRLRASKVGTFSLAGVGMKFSAGYKIYVYCTLYACVFEAVED